MNKQTKAWETPQLIILARGMPEESVLTGCKTQNPAINALGPAEEVSQDKCASGSETNCSNCKSRAFSDS